MSVIANQPNIEIAGENALIVYFKQTSLFDANEQVSLLAAQLSTVQNNILVDLIPSYISLLVIFDPLKTDYWAIKQLIIKHLPIKATETNIPNKTINIPVHYSTKVGPELMAIAQNAKLPVEEVINIHQQQTYQVFALGFAPGFAFLGEVDKRIATPRLATPRKKVPKGAVGIADQQTAVYPSTSPGGWNLIGLCPTSLFTPLSPPYTPFSVGDKVKFNAISEQEFLALGGKLDG